MNITYVIVLIFLLVALAITSGMVLDTSYENNEGLERLENVSSPSLTPLSNEAIQNIASVYNLNKIDASNATITGDLTSASATIANGLVAGKITSSNINVVAPDSSGYYGYNLSRTDENGSNHGWSLYHTPKINGQNDLQFWESMVGSDGKSCDSKSGGFCTPRLIISQGGDVKANGNMVIGGNTTVNSDIIVTGKLKKNNMLYRKNDVAGYFGVFGYARRVPLYYGWNMMAPDHNRTMNLRKKTSLPVSYSGIDMRDGSDGDQNWTPRFLTVFPDYLVRFYYYDVPSTDKDVYAEGEYDWTSESPGQGRRVHLINVSFKESPYNDTTQYTKITG